VVVKIDGSLAEFRARLAESGQRLAAVLEPPYPNPSLAAKVLDAIELALSFDGDAVHKKWIAAQVSGEGKIADRAVRQVRCLACCFPRKIASN